MNQKVDRIRKIRSFLLEIVKDVPIEQLNKIPSGFANNIIWHLGHIIAAQQSICYLRAGLTPPVPANYLQPYKPGTSPVELVSTEEAQAIKELLFSSLDLLETDLQNNLFGQYTMWTSRYGVAISSIDDALEFLLFHEGLHSGYITYMKRLVTD